MSARDRLPARLLRDASGSVAIEFGILGPVMIAMLLGVLQIGVAMQAYNSLRAASADVARYASVQYQNDVEKTNAEIRTYARTVATQTPYGLRTTGLGVAVSLAANQRATGVKELTLAYTYNVPNILGVIDVGSIPLSYSRPLFVLDD